MHLGVEGLQPLLCHRPDRHRSGQQPLRLVGIKVVESLGEGGMGLAQDQTIFIAERVFHFGGSKQVASTLIEEYVHLRHGWKDMTRELQSFLFDKLVSLGEELAGEPL